MRLRRPHVPCLRRPAVPARDGSWGLERAAWPVGTGTTRCPPALEPETSAGPPRSKEAFLDLHSPWGLQPADFSPLLRGERAVVGFIAREGLPGEVRQRNVHDLGFGQAEGGRKPGCGPASHAVCGVLVAIAQQNAAAGRLPAAG